MSEDSGSGSGGQEFDLAEPIGSFTRTISNVLLAPRDFFSGIALEGSLKNPLTFSLGCLLFSALLNGLMVYLDTPGTMSWTVGASLLGSTENLEPGATLPIVMFYVLISAPLSAVVGLYLYAGIAHLLVMLFMQQQRGFEATLRTCCYVEAVALLNWIPLVGWIAGLYGLYLLVVGSRQVHGSGSELSTVQG